jgi:general secretion pathway protein D
LITIVINKLLNKITKLCLILIAAQLLSSCAFAPWETSVNKNTVNEVALEEANAKVAKMPDGIVARKNLILTTELLANKLYKDAEIARSNNRYDEAKLIFDRVLRFLPDDTKSLNDMQKIERENSQSKKLAMAEEFIQYNAFDDAKEIIRSVLLENPESTDAKRVQKMLDEKSPPLKVTLPQLNVQFDKPINLELRDVNIKVAFEALSTATGVNFILDKDIKPDTKTNVFIKKANIEEAIEGVISSSGMQKKILSENTVLVYPNTLLKIKEYQDLAVRSFYFTNTSAKQVSALLKSMLKTKDIFVDDRLNMLVMRDTPEVIRIAEKLVAANDLADPEVMLEIEVLEVSRSRLQELGIRYPQQLSILSANDVLRLRELNNISSGKVGISPNPALNFKKTTGDVNLLSNPRIRVKNNEKAKVQVGDKIPVITTTSTANVGVSENVTYVDVGLKLDIETRITLDNYVNIKVDLEVSSLGERTTTANGANVFTIGTRSANTVLRLKDGETQILAGLISDEERKNASKLPGLGDIPLLGRLFSSHEDRKNKTEIVLAITPKVISNLSLPNAEVSEYWSGTETEILDKPNAKMPIQIQTKSPRELWLERNRSIIRRGIQPEQTQPEQTQPEQTQPEQTQPEQTQPEQTQPEQTPSARITQPTTVEPPQPALQNANTNSSEVVPN